MRKQRRGTEKRFRTYKFMIKSFPEERGVRRAKGREKAAATLASVRGFDTPARRKTEFFADGKRHVRIIK